MLLYLNYQMLHTNQAEAEAEEFFDFQLVRAKDLIRGIAIFQN